MEKNTEGAWIVHHSDKLSLVTNQSDFENIQFSGKCGLLLSALSESENQSDLNDDKVRAIAKAVGINVKLELRSILNALQEEEFIDVSKSGGVSTIGLTTSSVLSHTSTIYQSCMPSPIENAVIELAENISESPKNKSLVKELISDKYHISNKNTLELLSQTEEIGFIDHGQIDDSETLYFNGNMFRNPDTLKISSVIESLTSVEQNKLATFNSELDSTGCVPISKAKTILGENLLEKIQSIGLYDVNGVSNENSTSYFITHPGSFSKYGNPFVEDGLDLAKAFVASLTYGMIYSPSSRGQISMLSALLKKLIQGDWVGPATAIGKDYLVLEYKRVVEIRQSKQYPGRFYMRLLKKDIGEIALKVLSLGNASEDVLLYGSNIVHYKNPERNRSILRKTQTAESTQSTINTLRILRNK